MQEEAARRDVAARYNRLLRTLALPAPLRSSLGHLVERQWRQGGLCHEVARLVRAYYGPLGAWELELDEYELPRVQKR